MSRRSLYLEVQLRLGEDDLRGCPPARTPSNLLNSLARGARIPAVGVEIFRNHDRRPIDPRIEPTKGLSWLVFRGRKVAYWASDGLRGRGAPVHGSLDPSRAQSAQQNCPALRRESFRGGVCPALQWVDSSESAYEGGPHEAEQDDRTDW